MGDILSSDNQQLLNQEIQDFINENLDLPLEKILFYCQKNSNWNGSLIANQIHGIKKIKDKIPSWSKKESLLYPEKKSIEQCSSEATAIYKSKLAKGESFIDLTGGFGVDSFFIKQSFNRGVYCETNIDLFEIVKHNFKQLDCKVDIFNRSGIELLTDKVEKFDLIYIDPSRRNKDKKRVFKLEDYSPNIAEHVDLFLEKSDKILIKTAPFLDISQVMKSLPHLSDVHVISINNDCKEVLYLVDKNIKQETQVHCIDLAKETSFSFQYSQEQTRSSLSEPLSFLYEPNTSILKAGAFNSIATFHKVSKLHPNSHLYTSKELITNFHGRKFKVIGICKPNKKEVSKFIDNGKANISRRNFPLSTEEIRKKLKLKDGGNHYLFATTLANDKKVIIVTEKC